MKNIVMICHRRTCKSALVDFLRAHPELITHDGNEFKLNSGLTVVFDDADFTSDRTGIIKGEVGTYECVRIIESQSYQQLGEVKQHRIQHGPVRKGRGGKVRKW